MVMDTTQGTEAESTEAPPKYVTVEDFRRFQSQKDREVADERQLANDAFEQLTAMQSELERLRERGMEDDDPRVVAAEKRAREAEKKAQAAESVVKRFSPAYKQALVRAEAWDLADGDRSRVEHFTALLSIGSTQQQVLQIAQNLRSQAGNGGSARTPAPPPGRDEIDAGRGSGRAGAPRITRELLQQHQNDVGWYRQNKDAINAAMKDGLPDR